MAVDLLGGDHAPRAVLDAAALALADVPDVAVVLVGPADIARPLLDRHRGDSRLSSVDAGDGVGMDEHPVRAVRGRPDASVRVCAELVRDGRADALVSAGSTGATLTAAVLALGRLAGVIRPPLAAVVPTPAGRLVLLDAGATVECSPELLRSFALLGAAYAQVRLGLPRPRVGLLNVGSEPGKGDAVRKRAYQMLSAVFDGSPCPFVGNVEGHDVPAGGRADVVVADGFTGNVLVKCLEAATSTATLALRERLLARGEVDAGLTGDLLDRLLGDIAEATAPLAPDRVGGAVLLGVPGVVVVGHGASSPAALASCVRTAADAVRDDLVGRTTAALGGKLTRENTGSGAGGAS